MADDDEVERALMRALDAHDPVPTDVRERARSAFAWMALSGEIAQLEVDSAAEPVGVRSGSGRNLVYRSTTHEIHIEIGTGAPRHVVGRFLPVDDASIIARTTRGDVEVRTRRPGRFRIDDLPGGPLRLEITTEAGAVVITEWISP